MCKPPKPSSVAIPSQVSPPVSTFNFDTIMSVQIDSHQSIIDYCRSCPDDQLIGGSKYGNRVVKLPNYDLVVKFGQHVSSYEAKNQQEAYNTIDHNVVIVPWAHKFFVDDEGWGYMVSDFIPAKTIDPLPESHIRRLAKILEYFHSITSESTGSLCGGPSTGLLWPFTNDLFISSVQHVEDWFNSRLFPGDGEVHFDPSPSVLCHLDIAPRNIIWLDDGRVSLLDWESAGFYPRPLEFASLFFQEYHFGEALLNAMGFGSAHEKEEQQKMCQALFNNEKYSFRPRDTTEPSSHSSPADCIFPLPLIPKPQKLNLINRQSDMTSIASSNMGIIPRN